MNSRVNKSVQSIILKISNFFDTPYFALCLAAIELFCYVLALDLVIIVFISICLTFAFLFKKQLNCVLVLFLFMATMISVKHSPANVDPNSGRNYFFNTYVYVTCIIATAIPGTIVVARLIENFIRKRIAFDSVFFSTICLGAAFLLNGLFSENYSLQDFMFGGFMVFFYVILFFAMLPWLKINKTTIRQIALQVLSFSIIPVVEIIYFYILFFSKGNTLDPYLDVFVGWGNGNTLGMLFIVIFCFVLYLIQAENNKIIKSLYFVFSFLLIVCIIATFSRAAYLFIIVLFFTYFLGLIIIFKSFKQKKNIVYFGCLAGFALVAIVAGLLSGFFDSVGINFDSGGRFRLWKSAFETLKIYPVFGGGFYFLGGDPTIKLQSIMPYCCHNTIIEMFGACGLLGGISYLIYRFFGLKKICKNITTERFYVFVACLMMILMSLLDIHIMDLLGSAIYVTLLTMSLSKTDDDFDKNKFIDCFDWRETNV